MSTLSFCIQFKFYLHFMVGEARVLVCVSCTNKSRLNPWLCGHKVSIHFFPTPLGTCIFDTENLPWNILLLVALWKNGQAKNIATSHFSQQNDKWNYSWVFIIHFLVKCPMCFWSLCWQSPGVGYRVYAMIWFKQNVSDSSKLFIYACSSRDLRCTFWL